MHRLRRVTERERNLLRRGTLTRGALTTLLVAAACAPELELPPGRRPPPDAAAGAVDAGFTGTAGAPDTPEHPGKLPIVELPLPPALGGAGGEGNAGEGGESSSSVASPDEVAGGSSSQGGSVSRGPERPLSGAAGEGGSAGAPELPVGPRELFFSEYVEGSSRSKALEIYAPRASSLEGCELRTYSNGKAASASRLVLHGALATGETHVLCSSELASAEPARCDRSTNLSFNGDDALELVCDDQALDTFGQIGTDPGTAWGEGVTVDHTLRRRCSVTQGQPDGTQPFDPATEWLFFPIDTFTGLGEHTCTLAPP